MSPQIRKTLLIALGVRALIFIAALFLTQDVTIFHAKDTSSYLQPAIEMIDAGSFSTHGTPEIIRTPGYPIWLTIGLLFGQVEIVTVLLQILLGVSTVYLVYRITKIIFADEQIGLWGALLYSVEPVSIVYGCLLLSDSLFTFLIAVMTVLLLKSIKENYRLSTLCGAAVSLSAAIYVRPIGLLLPLIIGSVLLFRALITRHKNAAVRAVLFTGISISLIGIWQVRNASVAGYHGFSAAGDFNLYFHQVAAITSRKQDQPFYQVLDEMGFYRQEQYLSQHPEQASWTPARRYEFMRAAGIDAIKNEPVTFAQLYLKGIVIGLFDPGATEYLRLFKLFPRSGKTMNAIVQRGVLATALNFILNNPLIAFWSVFFGGILLSYYALAFIGFLEQSRFKNILLFLLLAQSVYLIAVAGGTVGAARFRMPAMILVCVLGGQGIAFMLGRWKLVREQIAIAIQGSAVEIGTVPRR